MQKIINGKIVSMTDEELAEAKRQEAVIKAQEKYRLLTESEVVSLFLSQKVQEVEVDDNTALRMKSYYPEFKNIIGKVVKKGFKFTYLDKLWVVIQPELTIQGHYTPGLGTESLYAEICESHEGTIDDPIPYSGNMALENGKYYIQDGEIYICIRDTINPVYHHLSDLIGLYVSTL